MPSPSQNTLLPSALSRPNKKVCAVAGHSGCTNAFDAAAMLLGLEPAGSRKMHIRFQYDGGLRFQCVPSFETDRETKLNKHTRGWSSFSLQLYLTFKQSLIQMRPCGEGGPTCQDNATASKIYASFLQSACGRIILESIPLFQDDSQHKQILRLVKSSTSLCARCPGLSVWRGLLDLKRAEGLSIVGSWTVSLRVQVPKYRVYSQHHYYDS